ncbi:MAG: FAD-linked oxidase [Coxiella sp. RIFCSPHIGHO2_12_FULL_44_14]|nr:MAG: FAD-linked oxidase [Coxiella sp. RIFCSPHIGHO2_12_FULL_44_14]
MNSTIVISQLIRLLSKDSVLLDDDSKRIYGKDLTQNDIPNPLAIAFPKNEKEIIEIIRLANATMTGLVPSGGRTGYSGGAVAKRQEIVVSFEKMNRILDFNSGDKNVKCEPGVTTKAVQDFALKNNLFYPIDFASAATCQIGGNIATNAGGIKVIRYGLTRNWVSGLRVVTGNGDLLELNYGLAKNACGYDFRHLFIGSEGTLGFITEATLRLIQPPATTKVVLFSVPDNNHFIDILHAFDVRSTITAFEFFSEIAIRHVIEELQLKHPFSETASFYILLEYESNKESDSFVRKATKECLKGKIVNNVLVSNNLQQNENFWRFRKEISMSLSRYFPYKYDISVLPSKIPLFIKEIDEVFNTIYPDLEIIWFGHVGDGNLHLNILKPSHLSADQFFPYCNEMSKQLYLLVQQYHGAVSAEHGIGLLKKNFLHYSKTDIEIDYMRAIKKIFDRNNIMNPGKII